MLKLQPFEICKLRDFCLYWRDCKGLDDKRGSVFSCLFAEEIKQVDEKEEPQNFPVCSLNKSTTTGCS